MAATQSSQAIAHVVSVKGEAYAKAADGSMRLLHAGDLIYVGETLVTPQGSEIVVAFQDGHEATILAGESFYMAPEVAHDFQPDLNQAAVGTAEIDKVIQAINQGGDLSNMLEETAAGIAAGVGGENGGNSFVRLLRISEGVTPLEYQFTPPTEAIINEPAGTVVVPEEDGVPSGANDATVVDEDGSPLLPGANPDVGGDAPSSLVDSLGYDFGPDGPGSFIWDPAAVVTNGGLTELTSGGAKVNFYLESGGKVVGSTANSVDDVSPENTVFVLEVTNIANGTYNLTLFKPLDHAPGGGENSLDIQFGYTIVDGNGTPAAGTLTITVNDDTPIIDLSSVRDDQISLTTQDADTDTVPSGTGTDTATASFAAAMLAAVTPTYGADGAGSTVLSGYALTVKASDSGLTSHGDTIYLYAQTDGSVVGSTASTAGEVTTGNSIFAISVSNATGDAGTVTLTQYQQIDHLPEDADATNDNAYLALANGKVELSATATVTDFDNDQVTDTVTVDLGGNIGFDDDVPSVDVGAVTESSITVTTQDADTDTVPSGTGTDTATASFAAAMLAAVTPTYGADGAG
ncbi:MAG: retention module-containing protein, partial [Hydrogenophilaceae bacterium]